MHYKIITIWGLLAIMPVTLLAEGEDAGNTPATAKRASAGSRLRETLSSPADVDFYQLRIRDSSGNLSANFTQEAPPGADPNSGWRIDLFAESDLANSLYTTRLPETRLEAKFEVGLAPGNYYYKISSINDTVFPAAEYTLKSTWEASENYEKQPNDSPDTATIMRANEHFYGNLSVAEDIDFFRLTLPTPDLVTITLSQDNPGSDPNSGWLLSVLNPPQEIKIPSTTLFGTFQLQMEANVPYYIRIGSFEPEIEEGKEPPKNIQIPVGRRYKLFATAATVPQPPKECPAEVVYGQHPSTARWVAFPTICEIPTGWNQTKDVPEGFTECPKCPVCPVQKHASYLSGLLNIPLIDLLDADGKVIVDAVGEPLLYSAKLQQNTNETPILFELLTVEPVQ
jgi:hypothetical protein